MILGREAVRKEGWDEAASHFEKVVALNPRPEVKAEAYFYIGMARWKEGDVEEAMDSFAKCSIQKGAPHARSCRKYLETLKRSGMDNIYDPPLRHSLPPRP